VPNLPLLLPWRTLLPRFVGQRPEHASRYPHVAWRIGLRPKEAARRLSRKPAIRRIARPPIFQMIRYPSPGMRPMRMPLGAAGLAALPAVVLLLPETCGLAVWVTRPGAGADATAAGLRPRPSCFANRRSALRIARRRQRLSMTNSGSI